MARIAGLRPPLPALLILLAILSIAAATALAQSEVVTDTDVIQVAQRMYCPVCENIPLDECQTITCSEWKEEIRNMLAAGRSEQDVIDSFVARFGDDVVGLPQDPVLRALTFLLPALATALALGIGIATFRRFGGRQKLRPAQEQLTAPDAYRQRLEDDLRARP